MTLTEFQLVKQSIPNNIGVYKFYNKKDEIIYIGKAKNLIKRISNYFNAIDHNRKTIELVLHIFKIEFVLVDSEHDALILENRLIKEFKPKYNIRLKDDKSYPYIVIKNENFPRVLFSRKKKENVKDEYIGPFSAVGNAYKIFSYIKENFQLRTCNFNLTPNSIAQSKFKVCLEYHIGNCQGPCVGYQTIADYNQDINHVKQILKGNIKPVLIYLKSLMWQHAKNLEFEKANKIKNNIEKLQNFQSTSIIQTNFSHNIDVIYISTQDKIGVACYLGLNAGQINQTHTIPFLVELDSNLEEMYSFIISYIKNTFKSTATEIILPVVIENFYNCKITIPKQGNKLKLLELAKKNTQFALKETIHRNKIIQPINKEIDYQSLLKDLQKFCQLKNTPYHIECFDNSNIQGNSPVGAMVCFKNGQAVKNNYRKFHIKTVKGINDFASMKEIVFRRYKSILVNNLPLPDLIIIDGGKGQLNSAYEALILLNIADKIDIIGLAKRLEELFLPNNKDSLKLNWDTPALNFIRNIRDEVHRFGINFHRKTRSKNMFS